MHTSCFNIRVGKVSTSQIKIINIKPFRSCISRTLVIEIGRAGRVKMPTTHADEVLLTAFLMDMGLHISLDVRIFCGFRHGHEDRIVALSRIGVSWGLSLISSEVLEFIL